MSQPSGFTQITAANIQDAGANRLAAGTLEVLPTDANDRPITATAGGVGGPLLTRAAVFPIVNGVLPSTAGVADTALTNPPNISYRFTVKDPTGTPIYTIKGVQFATNGTATATFDLDTYTPNVAAQAVIQMGPVGPAGPAGATGVAGPAGTVTATGVAGAFTVPGTLTTTQLAVAQVSLNSNHLAVSGPSPAAELDQDSSSITVAGPGTSLGNVGGWSVFKDLCRNLVVATRGIVQLIGGSVNHQGNGDTAGLYVYAHSDGGISAGSDEGVVGIQAEVSESNTWFHGTVSATTGTGDIQPTLAFTAGNNWINDGHFLLNISKGTLAGNLNGASVPVVGHGSDGSTLSVPLNQLPVTNVTLPLTTAWGTIAATIAGSSKTADGYVSSTQTVTLGKIGASVQSFVVGYATLAGSYNPERVKITAVGSATTTGLITQTVTFLSRNPSAGAVLFQGGIAGQFLSFDANIMRSSYYAYGSLDGVHLIYAYAAAGSAYGRTLPLPGGNEAATTTGANSGFHLYPGAEVVMLPGVNSIAPTLEQNNVPWAVPDVVENPHYPIYGGHGIWITKVQNSPADPTFQSYLAEFDIAGPGVTGAVTGLLVRNGTDPTLYASSGGTTGAMLSGPTGYGLEGPWDTSFYVERSPAAWGALLYVDYMTGPTTTSINVISLPIANAGSTQTVSRSSITYSSLDGSYTVPLLRSPAMTAIAGNVDAPALLVQNSQIPGISAYVNVTSSGMVFGIHNATSTVWGDAVHGVPANSYSPRVLIGNDGTFSSVNNATTGGNATAENQIQGAGGVSVNSHFKGVHQVDGGVVQPGYASDGVTPDGHTYLFKVVAGALTVTQYT